MDKFELSRQEVKALIGLARRAGEAIMKIYDRPVAVELKHDSSPLTIADKLSNDIIVEGLQQLFPNIPIISEELKQTGYEQRESWSVCWLVDPLDGTKEFINHNGEFTVNIALVKNGSPVFGIVHLPALNKLYYGIAGAGAYRIDETGTETKLPDGVGVQGVERIAGSRSHRSDEMDHYLAEKKERGIKIEFTSAGSALKFCLVAEGSVDEYPRFGPTMEWDTAAGQAIVEAAGGIVLKTEDSKPLKYNKENLLNPFFIACLKQP